MSIRAIRDYGKYKERKITYSRYYCYTGQACHKERREKSVLHDNGAVRIHTRIPCVSFRPRPHNRRELPRVALRVKRNTHLLFRTTAKRRGKERREEEKRGGKRKREGRRERERDSPPYQQAFPPHLRLQRLRRRREAIYRATLSRYRRARTYARRTLTTLYIYNGARFALSAPVSLGSLAAQHEPEKRARGLFYG